MDDISQWIQAAGQHHAAGELAPAESLYAQALARDPHRLDARCGIAVLFSQTGRHAQALAYFPRDIVLNSGSTLLLVALAGSLLAEHDPAAAIPFLQKALQIDPVCPEAHNTLGAALLEQGRILDAVMALRTALQHRPAYPEAYYNLGRTLYSADMPADALSAYDAALRLRPGYAQALLNKGFAQRKLGLLDEAASSFRLAMTVRPGYSQAMHNLAVTLAEQGQVAQGVQWLRRAVQTDSDNMLAHSALVYLLLFDPAATAADLAAQAALWNQRHAQPLASAAPAFENRRDPHRQLRIGFVSPDFRAHAECRFMLPLLAHLDSTQFQVHCYSSVRAPDEITRQMQNLAHVWHDVRAAGDAELARRITEDRIDILIDLTMHMEDHRLLVFARRPAPVQLSWLAYPGTTGLQVMDYHLTDVRLHPSADLAAAERPLYLPEAWFCYQAAPDLPEVSPLPALSAGVVTFGSLNAFRKISPQVLEVWSRILAAVPRSRLILITPEGSHRKPLLDHFQIQQIAADRLDLLAPMPFARYLALCHRIDIALDPFPHAGATTTLDLFNMGVPVVSLRGTTPAGRLGESILTTADLTDWLAATPDDYVRKAAHFAADLPRLANLRAGLRPRIAASPLMNATRFAHHFGHALRTAWHAWCDAPQAPQAPPPPAAL